MLHFRGTADEAVDEYLKVYADNFEDMSLEDIPRTDVTNGLVKFIGFEYVDYGNTPIEPHCGKPLRVRLKVRVAENLDAVYVSAGVRTMLGEPIMSFPSHCTMDDFPLTEGEHYINLDIPKLPLSGGNYRLGLWCSAKNLLSKTNCADYLDNVIKLNVEPDDFFTNGKLIAPHLSGKVVLCDHKWVIE